MKNFWGFVKNEKYAIGCTGLTTYVFDGAGNEIAKFKDIIYAYTPMFCPGKNMFVVKSTDGWLAFYSLDTMQLLKKVHFSKIGAQDEGLCFSPDGRYLYNIEKPVTSTETEIAIYETDSFHIQRRLFQGERTIHINHIEYDSEKSAYFVLGFCRGGDGVFSYGFVSELVDNSLTNIKRIPDKEYHYLDAYKSLELQGFTKKATEWSTLKNKPLKHMKLSDAQLLL